MTPQADGITFEVERLATTAPGRVEVSGRWYGIRGRRFVRPTLTFILTAGGAEQRLLADLEHKPWAALDGEPWQAAFALEGELPAASRIELNVAPDITVELGPNGDGTMTAPASGRRARVSSATHARSPVIRDEPARPRPRAPRSPEVERLHERLAIAETVITRERTRREAADQALQDERRSARTLQAELGRVRAEAELARTVQRELDTASAELDRLRRAARESRREHDQDASAGDAARRELDAERAGAERLRSQLADAEAAVRRLTQAGRETRSVQREPRSAEREVRSAEREVRSADRKVRSPAGVPAAEDRPDTGFPDLTEDLPEPNGDVPARTPLLPRADRPVNPSLRASNWVGRGIALVVLMIVIAAIVVVINSTVH